jgi:PAS domain S-box-containing protein
MISVLYVDDEPDLLELGKIFLEATGDFSITTTESAEKGLEILAGSPFDLVLSDYSMPGMDGIMFLKAIRSRRDPVPFILFTGRGREEVVVEAINNGADFYLQKGGEIKSQFSELAHKIRQAVRRRKAEGALAESRDYLNRIFTSVRAGIIVIDAASHAIIDVNPVAAEMIGLPREEIINKTCHQYVCPAETGKCPITDLGQTVDNSEKLLITSDGTRVPIIKYVTRVTLSGRDSLLETFIDNTERKRAENELRTAYEELKLRREENVAAYAELAANEQVLLHDYAELLRSERELRESTDQYRILFESANDAIFLIETGIITGCNQRTIEIFGCTEKSQVIGQPISTFTPEFQPDGRRSEEVIREYDTRVIEGEPMTFEWLHKRRDGTPFYASVSLNRTLISDKMWILSVIRDISESKRANQATLLASRKLQMLNQITRHQIQNIVTGLVGMVEMTEAATTDDERDRLFRQKKNLIAALQRQLEFTEEYQEVGTNAPGWQRIAPLITAYSSITTTVSPELSSLEIFADPLIARVITGILENSLRHGVHATEIRVHAEINPNYLTLYFDDNGTGIPGDEKEEIFEHKIGKRGGTGLFLAREILGITGITLIESGEWGKGARFEMRVPPTGFRGCKIR